MQSIKVSFIIPLFNHVEYFQEMLSSLLRSLPINLSYEIIFIDDASSDTSAQWLRSLDYSFVTKLFNTINLGYAKSNNVAVAHAKGEILALVNNDLIFKQGWLEPMLSILENSLLNAGIVGNIQYKVADNSVDHAGVTLTTIGQIDHVHDLPSEDYVRSFSVTGACLLIRKIDFIEAGCFDEDYLNGGEDIDLCLEIRARGKYIYLATKSHIHHHVSLSRDRVNIQNEINSRRLHLKWRKELKNELAKQWGKVLQSNADISYRQYIDGELTAAFINTPYSASQIIAEHFLLREEFRWSKEIDHVDFNKDIAANVMIRGLISIASSQYYLINKKAEITFKHIASVINFYVCGRRIDQANQDNLAITISVNHVQYKTLPLHVGPNINLGIISPLLLQGINNVFKVEVNFYEPDTLRLLGDASHLIYVTNFVIDDKPLKL